jgi:hypothetical protein
LTLITTIFDIAKYCFASFYCGLAAPRRRGNSPRNKQRTERMSEPQLTELVHVASITSELRSIQAI